MKGLLSRWSARTGVISLAIVLTLCLGLTLAAANLDSGSGTSSSGETTATSVSPSTSPTPEGTQGSSTSSGGGGSVNNEVVVQNRTDGHFAHREGFGAARVTGGDVTNTNSAAAVASCTDCRTVAIATQVVLVMGDSSNISPVNQAVAINGGCLRCETAALAYQYVVSTGGTVRFNAEGNQQLAALQAEIRSVASNSEISFPELEAQVDAIVERMWAVIDSEIVAVGGRPEGTEYKDFDETQESDSPSPTPTPTSSPDGGTGDQGSSGGSTPSPTPTEDNTVSPTPTPSASTEPETSPTPSASP